MQLRHVIKPGDRFGMLTVIGDADRSKHRQRRVSVRCDCGAEKSIFVHHLILAKSCGCAARRGRKAGPTFVPKGAEPGTRYGRLTILRHDPVKAGQSWRVICACDCGAEHTALISNIRGGLTRSCGCLALELTSERTRTHGLTGTPIWRTWASMRARCECETATHFDRYGGRGITVCARWRDSVAAFAGDMGSRPNGRSIDRIDNDGGYWCGKAECPECGPLGRAPNCRWATDLEQARNTSRTVRVEVDGQLVSTAELRIKHGITRQAFESRVRSGWTPLRAATTPPNPRRVEGGRAGRAARMAALGRHLTTAQVSP